MSTGTEESDEEGGEEALDDDGGDEDAADDEPLQPRGVVRPSAPVIRFHASVKGLTVVRGHKEWHEERVEVVGQLCSQEGVAGGTPRVKFADDGGGDDNDGAAGAAAGSRAISVGDAEAPSMMMTLVSSGIQSSVVLDPPTLDYIYNNLDPVYNAEDSPYFVDILTMVGVDEDELDGKPLDELDVDPEQVMWAAIECDRRLQRQLLEAACGLLEVVLSREKRTLKIALKLPDLMLC